jgi:fructose-bisphosphate aldolase, class I
MTSHVLESVALMLVAEGKGILAADETIATLTKRFDTLEIRSRGESTLLPRNALYLSWRCGVHQRRYHV